MIYRNRVNAPTSVNTLPYIWPTDVPINSGDITVFAQTNAPTGYTKLTTHNDKALRIVSGAVGSGGTSPFSTVFTNQNVVLGLTTDSVTLNTTQIASHTHFVGAGVDPNWSYLAPNRVHTYSSNSTAQGGSAGGGGSHLHPITTTPPVITLNVQYRDIILATKN